VPALPLASSGLSASVLLSAAVLNSIAAVRVLRIRVPPWIVS
jgi:hypothetical protein